MEQPVEEASAPVELGYAPLAWGDPKPRCLGFLWRSHHRLPCSSNSKEAGDQGLIPGLGSSSGEGNGNPLQNPGEFHGQRSLAGYSSWGRKD